MLNKDEMINQFWEYLPYSYHIESREEFEKLAKQWDPPNPLLVVLHHIWKREPNVGRLEKEIKELKEEITSMHEDAAGASL